jgi:hypothetical protein
MASGDQLTSPVPVPVVPDWRLFITLLSFLLVRYQPSNTHRYLLDHGEHAGSSSQSRWLRDTLASSLCTTLGASALSALPSARAASPQHSPSCLWCTRRFPATRTPSPAARTASPQHALSCRSSYACLPADSKMSTRSRRRPRVPTVCSAFSLLRACNLRAISFHQQRPLVRQPLGDPALQLSSPLGLLPGPLTGFAGWSPPYFATHHTSTNPLCLSRCLLRATSYKGHQPVLSSKHHFCRSCLSKKLSRWRASNLSRHRPAGMECIMLGFAAGGPRTNTSYAVTFVNYETVIKAEFSTPL